MYSFCFLSQNWTLGKFVVCPTVQRRSPQCCSRRGLTTRWKCLFFFPPCCVTGEHTGEDPPAHCAGGDRCLHFKILHHTSEVCYVTLWAGQSGVRKCVKHDFTDINPWAKSVFMKLLLCRGCLCSWSYYLHSLCSKVWLAQTVQPVLGLSNTHTCRGTWITVWDGRNPIRHVWILGRPSGIRRVFLVRFHGGAAADKSQMVYT